MCGSGVIVCGLSVIEGPSVDIVLASAVNWLSTKLETDSARNSKFHVRVAIANQYRDSVTPALEKLEKIIDEEKNVLFIGMFLTIEINTFDATKASLLSQFFAFIKGYISTNLFKGSAQDYSYIELRTS